MITSNSSWQRPFAIEFVAQFAMKFFKTTTSGNILNLNTKIFTNLVVWHPQPLSWVSLIHVSVKRMSISAPLLPMIEIPVVRKGEE